MNRARFTYVLAGGGAAASAAAAAIRVRDPVGSVLIVGQEHNRPYERPPLSKSYLRRQTRHEEMFIQSPDWFHRNQIVLRSGQRVANLDPARHCLTLGNAEEVSYEKLLIATGATPRQLAVPGANLPNLFYLRTMEDADRLGHAIDQAKAEGRPHSAGRGRVTVIGAGWLGVELAGTLTQIGLAVDLVVGREHPWAKFAGPSAGGYATRYLASHGIHVINGQRAIRLEGDGRVQRVILDDGQGVACDFAVAAIGASANRDLLRNTAITAEHAVLVDDRTETSVKNIYAAGDCAAVFDPLFGKHRIIDHWDHAVRTGTIAGANMAGGNERYTGVTMLSTETFDLRATLWGEPRLVYRRIVRGNPAGENSSFAEIGIAADGRVACVLAVGPTEEATELRKMVEQRLLVDGNQEQIKDQAVPLDRLLG